MLRRVFGLAVAGIVLSAGIAAGGHTTVVPPGDVPEGMLAAHIAIRDVPLNAFARAMKPGGADVMVEHLRLGNNVATGWHTHPGPAIVTVVQGSLTYQDAHANSCRNRTYVAGEGFIDSGFGHVHRGIAGPTGVHLYTTYVMPPGSATHRISATAPAACL